MIENRPLIAGAKKGGLQNRSGNLCGVVGFCVSKLSLVLV